MSHPQTQTAMILAAGRGSRMKSLTDSCPKPLLRANGQHLIEYPIHQLATAGIQHIVINTAYLGEQLPKALGNGERYGVNIAYSHEGGTGLETAGGIIRALPKLLDTASNTPFIVVNGDVFCDYPYEQLALPNHAQAHLILADNPEHNPAGDFSIVDGRLSQSEASPRYTFTGIGIYHADFFKGYADGIRPMRELFERGIENNTITAEYYSGQWSDIGTPERLAALDKQLKESKKA